MSRSGYCDDWYASPWEMILWRGAVAASIRGKRGQAMLKELAGAMDAMPNRRLIAGALVEGGETCAIGCLGIKRGIDMSNIDPYEPETVAKAFGIARALAQEIAYINDEGYPRDMSPEERWKRVRQWVADQIKNDS